MGKRIVSVLLCALLLCLCAGCGSYKADASFTYLLEQNVTSLDPQTASNSAAELVISSLFEGLCRIDEDGEAIPGVARSWEANSDSTEFTFHLRRNAQWSDGTPLTAQDFVYGITRALSPATGSTPGDLLLIRGAKSFAAGEGDASALGVVAEDEHTLIIRLEKSNPDFPALTAGAHYMPCSQVYFESCQGHYGLSSQYLLTNGPFTFGSAYAWQTDSGKRSITVSRSDTYRGERRVQAASVTFLIDYDEAYETDPVTALTSGEVDILTLTEAQAQQAQEAGCGVMALDDAVTGLLLNPASDKLADATLRSLFFKTLNRQDLLAQRGDAVEAQGIMPACVLWDGEPYYAPGTQAYTLQDTEAAQGIPSLLRQLDLEEMPSITVLCADDPESVAVVNTFLAPWAMPSTWSGSPPAPSKAALPPATTRPPCSPCGPGAPPPTTCSSPLRAPPCPPCWRAPSTTRPWSPSPLTWPPTRRRSSSCKSSTSFTPSSRTRPTTPPARTPGASPWRQTRASASSARKSGKNSKNGGKASRRFLFRFLCRLIGWSNPDSAPAPRRPSSYPNRAAKRTGPPQQPPPRPQRQGTAPACFLFSSSSTSTHLVFRFL